MTSSGQEITQSLAKPTRLLGFWTHDPLTAALSEGEIFQQDYVYMAPQHPYINLHHHLFARHPLSLSVDRGGQQNDILASFFFAFYGGGGGEKGGKGQGQWMDGRNILAP